MQPLVACDTRYPHNRVIRSIRRCDPRRASTGLILAPGERDRGRTCGRNFVSPDLAEVVMKSDIRPLSGVVRHSRDSSVDSTDIGLGHRRSDAAQIVTINQVGIPVLAKRKHQL